MVLAVTVAGRHGKGVGVVRQWRGRGVYPDAGITDDNPLSVRHSDTGVLWNPVHLYR